MSSGATPFKFVGRDGRRFASFVGAQFCVFDGTPESVGRLAWVTRSCGSCSSTVRTYILVVTGSRI